MGAPAAFLTLALAATTTLGEDDGKQGFTWAGVAETPKEWYLWTMQKVDGSYAEPRLKLAALPAASATEAGLEGLEEDGEAALNQTCLEIAADDVITPGLGRCYELVLDERTWQTQFLVNASAAARVAFFTEHAPAEFKSTAHFFKDDHGHDVQLAVQELLGHAHSDGHDRDRDGEEVDGPPWGQAIGAAIVVNLTTFIGVVFLSPCLSAAAWRTTHQLEVVMAAFAAGALLSCAFFLLLFEAAHLIATGWGEETDVTWRWAAMVLAGFLMPAVLDFAVAMFLRLTAALVDGEFPGGDAPAPNPNERPHLADPSLAESPLPIVEQSAAGAGGANDGAPGKDGEALKGSGLEATARRVRVLGGVLIGDFMHNFVDGIFMGVAFRACGASMGWSVAASSVAHELAQELSDYILLTSPSLGALRPFMALALNFVAGLSVALGVVVILGSGEAISPAAQGLILAFGGGVYLHMGATECMPRVYSLAKTAGMRLVCLLSFVVGCVVIGLVLLDHRHCERSEDAVHAEHADHGHGHA